MGLGCHPVYSVLVSPCIEDKEMMRISPLQKENGYHNGVCFLNKILSTVYEKFCFKTVISLSSCMRSLCSAVTGLLIPVPTYCTVNKKKGLLGEALFGLCLFTNPEVVSVSDTP